MYVPVVIERSSVFIAVVSGSQRQLDLLSELKLNGRFANIIDAMHSAFVITTCSTELQCPAFASDVVTL